MVAKNTKAVLRRKTIQMSGRIDELEAEVKMQRRDALFWRGLFYTQLRLNQIGLDGWEQCHEELKNLRKEYDRLFARKVLEEE